jgi:hypothetical protein
MALDHFCLTVSLTMPLAVLLSVRALHVAFPQVQFELGMLLFHCKIEQQVPLRQRWRQLLSE